MLTNSDLIAKISTTHGMAAGQNVKNFFSKLPDSAYTAEVSRSDPAAESYTNWAAGLLDGLRVLLILQGHETLTAERIRDHVWNEWPRLRA